MYSALTAPLSFALLRLLSHAGFFVKTATLQLTEQPFSRELPELRLFSFRCYIECISRSQPDNFTCGRMIHLILAHKLGMAA